MGIYWLIFAVLLWGLVHSLLASGAAKDFARRQAGSLADHFYRLTYNLFALISFVPVLAVAATADHRVLYVVPLPWSALMVLGELLAVVALLEGFRETDVWEFLGLRQLGDLDQASPTLVTGGLYQFVRHPLYTAGLVFIWLLPYMTVNILAINLALTVYILVGAFFEERKLRRVFGQAYSEYAAVTPMLIPFTRWNKSRTGTSLEK
jgi:protein-S-isoprenylcysteine O-methyltransferase Ste14